MSLKINENTLDYIKRITKGIKKSEGIKHTEALEKSAKLCGFNSYKDCVKQFKDLES